MKNLSKLILVSALTVWGANTTMAQQSLKGDKANKAAEVKDLVQSKDYVFEATHTTAKKGDMPLNYHTYDVAIAKDTLIAQLPDGEKFACTNFAYNEERGKNGDWDIVIKPNTNMSDVKQLRLDVSRTGHAMLHVTTRGHGPLELDGYIKQEDY